MSEDGQQISNPFSMGGGGVNFEVHVQASFVALMLAGGFAPCLPCLPIRKIRLQARHTGQDTDDLLVIVANEDGTEKGKLLGQIKHSITISEGDPIFGSVILSAWKDFNKPTIFSKSKDAIALITGPLSATDIDDTRFLLEWARHSDTAKDFLRSVQIAQFSSDGKRKKLAAFRSQLAAANGGDVTDEELVSFLKHFHLIGYDLDIKSGMMQALMHSIIGQYFPENATSIWAQIVQETMSANQNAGTITLDSLPKEIRRAFRKREVRTMPEEISQSLPPRKAQGWNTSEYSSALVVANLLGAWNEKVAADMAIARRMVDGKLEEWLSKVRSVLQMEDCPLRLQDGVWAVEDRELLWKILGPSVFDSHLDSFRQCALTVFKEKDPQFDLESEERCSASIHGKVLSHSPQLRKGLAETLALLGCCPEPLINCSHEKPVRTAVLSIREVFLGADWLLWGSLNDLLPSLAEASPDEFLRAVEFALSQNPCPFDGVFAQEGDGIFGRNYTTGLLWALEGCAWDEQYLVRSTMALGALAERDPGGQWANRPSNSLTTIFLPWLPQTMAPIEKRKIAVQTLQREFPNAAWNLLLTLLPDQVRTSSHTHKPIWRKTVPKDWEGTITKKEYWDQVSNYVQMASEMAFTDLGKLTRLVSHLDHLPRPESEKLLVYLSKDEMKRKPEEERFRIWTSLTELVLKHRRFSDAEWALPGDIVSRVESVANDLAPKSLEKINQRYFSGRDWDLYEENGDWQGQEKKLEDLRRETVRQLLENGGVERVVQFSESVESPNQLGFSLGSVAGNDIDGVILPSMLNAERESLRKLSAGFIWGRFRKNGLSWADTVIKPAWNKMDVSRFLAILPFTGEIWERADRLLGTNSSEYWKDVAVNPYQAEGDLTFAIAKLIENGRPWAAIDCLAKVVRDKKPFDNHLAVKSLLSALNSEERRDVHDALEIIKVLQKDPGTSPEDLFRVEWAYLPLLESHRGVSPKHLETRIASTPDFFCELVRIAFRSEKVAEPPGEPDKKRAALAQNAFRLLREWKNLPGTVGKEFSGETFKSWVKSVITSTTESGHLTVALINIGNALIHSPADPGGLWMHRSVADILNERDMEEMRNGFSTAIHNSRGVHWVDPTGKPEKEYAAKYRKQADEMENAGYQRIASTLRNIAESYDREAARIIADHDD
jgi:hypothetical protein